MTGSSTRHGPHHAAQTLTTDRMAAQRARPRACRPLRAPGSRSLAWRAARRAPAGRRRAWRAAAPGGDLAHLRLRSGSWTPAPAAGRRRRPPRGRSPRGSKAAGGASREGCQTRPRVRRTRPMCGILRLTHGEGRESREVPPVHRPRTSRGLRVAQALSHAATLRFRQIARPWLIPCRRPPRPHRFPIRPPSSAPRAFTRERFVHDGEDPAVALAPGSRAPPRARRRAARDRRRREGARRRSGAGATRCCSASSACSARTSRASPTARCSTPTRSTRSRAR